MARIRQQIAFEQTFFLQQDQSSTPTAGTKAVCHANAFRGSPPLQFHSKHADLDAYDLHIDLNYGIQIHLLKAKPSHGLQTKFKRKELLRQQDQRAPTPRVKPQGLGLGGA